MTERPGETGAGPACPTESAEATHSRLNRNWHDLLQELRVTQTAVQILTGFLLILPFSPGFDDLEQSRRILYCAVLGAALTATFVIMTPVVLHRSLFRAGQKAWLVEAAHRVAQVGSVVLAGALVGAMWLIVDHVLGLVVATSVLAFFVAGLLGLWVALPWYARSR